ncbi:MAG TPA: hypothetical protein VEJ63_07030 [Planctomycetota bacterium]|nr:hypothetical protein [Planctomycetota bacterium]
MLRILSCLSLLVAFGLAAAAGPSSPVKDLAKRTVDRNANWVIEKYDVKAKRLGKPEESADPSMWAMYITAICEQRRDYKEVNGPFVSDPVEVLLSKVTDKGTIEGARDDGGTEYMAAEALEATKNPKYKDVIEKLRKVAHPPALPLEIKTVEQLTSIDLQPQNLMQLIAACRKLAKDGKKEITVGDKTVNWAETISEGLMKKEQKQGTNGWYTGDLRTDMLVLQLLNVCYKQL